MGTSNPVVGIACDRRMVGDHWFHMVGEKYINAVRDGAGCLPFLIPVLVALVPLLPPANRRPFRTIPSS